MTVPLMILAERGGRPHQTFIGGIALVAAAIAVLGASTGALLLYAGATAATMRLDQLGLATIGVAFGLAHGIFYPTFNALAVEQSGEHERGKAMALFNGAFNVGYSCGVFGFGIVADRAGYPPVFTLAAAAAGLGFLVLLTRRRSRSPRA